MTGSSEGWFSRLKNGLARTRVNIVGLFSGGVIDDDFLEELEYALITADVGVQASTRILQRLRDTIKLKGLKTQDEVRLALRDEIARMLAPAQRELDIEQAHPLVIMMTGVNGAGKTTSIGKISKELDREVIRKVQMIFQDPMASLNERAKVEYIVAEGLLNHHLYKDQNDLHEKVMNALHEVGLLPEFASRFPHEFSGGQRQRIGIARALVMEPEFIVADEPISALDVSIRAQVLNLLNSMKKSRGLTYLFIAHDLSVVRFISDRIAVISKGRIVELAEAEELFLHPLHPYTKALLSAVPIPDPGLEKKKKLLVYDPSIHDYSVDKPVWEEIANGHFVYGNQKELEGYRKEYQSQL